MRRIGFFIISGIIGGSTGSLGILGWWPAWVILAAWFAALGILYRTTPMWLGKLLGWRAPTTQGLETK